jgi:hypothetical protein
VIDDYPIRTIPRITDAPPIMQSCNPTAKRALQNTPQLHWRVTRNNTPGILPAPCTVEPARAVPPPIPRPVKHTRDPQQVQPPRGQVSSRTAVPGGARHCIVTRQAMNVLTLRKEASLSTIHTPRSLMQHAKLPVNFEHYVNPMVHPVTGQTISSYKKLMHDPATAEVWQTAFGKDFGGMAQGCNKMGQKGTNAMFVMSHDEIMHALAAKKKNTYANPVVNYRPQKEDPHRICITAGGNLINYKGNASVRTADLDTAKLHWNSVVSTKDARYMCLDIKFFLSHRGPRLL